MATYIKGVTDYIPQIQPWSPDYNFYQNALERKQASYDRGWEQTNSIYNSILNAPMMRAQNVERRDNFFQEIEGQIQQMSSVDLSLQQNVDAAASVFKPFYENDDIVHDIAYTRKYQDQMQHVDYLKNCTDKKECGGKYWAGGKRLLGYKAQEFINATDEEALRMQAPTYTNYVNFMDKATKAIDEVGKGKWEMVTTSFDGGYKIQTKNGKQQVGTLQNFMMARFGDDPEVNEFYNAKAELMGYEEPEKLINLYETEKLRSEATSEEELQSLIKERAERKRFDAAVTTIDEKAKEEKSGLDGMIERQSILEGIITSKGVLPDSKEAKEYRELSTEIPMKESAVKKTNQAASYIQNMQYVDEDGNRISSNVINNVVAQALLMGDIGRTANTLAYRDYSVTMKADQYSLASFKNQLDIAKDDRAAARTNAESTIKYIRDRGADDNATKLERERRDAIDALTIGEGMDYQGTKYTGLSNADALVVYRKLFAHKNNTGKEYYDGVSAYTTEEGTTVDDMFSKAIDDAAEGSVEEADHAANVIDEDNNRMYNEADIARGNAQGAATEFVDKKMKGLIQKILNPAAADKKIAAQGMLKFGDLIAEAKQNNTPMYQKLLKSKVWDKYFEDFPNSKTRYQNGTKPLAQLNIDDNIGYISDLIGVDKIVDIINNVDVPITVMDKKDPTLIDTEALGIITHDEATRLENNISQESGSFKDLNTPEERQLLYDYHHKTDSIRDIQSSNFLHTLTTDQDQKQLTEIAYNKKNAESMMNSLNLAIDDAARIYGEETDGEKDGVMRTFMRKNILQKPNDNIRKTSNRQDLYSAAAAEGVTLLDNYKKDNITLGIQPSLAKLEGDSDYTVKNAQGQEVPLMLQGDALQGIISTADMPVNISAINYEKLYADNDIPLVVDKPQMSRGDNLSFRESLNVEPMWETLINDPNTHILRDNNKIKIRSPYLETPQNSLVLSTSDIEVNEGVQDMFNDINNQYGNIIHGYGKQIQNVPDETKYLVYGTGGDFQGLNASNYNITSRTATGIQLVPNDPIPAYPDYVQLFEEIQRKLGDIDLNTYAITEPQGNATFLNNVVMALQDTYKDGKDMPIFDVDYTPVAGTRGLTKVNIKLNDYKAQDWIKAMGYEVTGIKMPDQEQGDFVPPSVGSSEAGSTGSVAGLSGGSRKDSWMVKEATYYIENSKSRIIQKSKSNSYHNVMANIPVGNSHYDESAKNKYGGYIRYDRTSRSDVTAYMIYPEYNWDDGTTYYRTTKVNEWPLVGTDWKDKVTKANQDLKLKHNILDNAYKKAGVYITNPSEF